LRCGLPFPTISWRGSAIVGLDPADDSPQRPFIGRCGAAAGFYGSEGVGMGASPVS